MIKQVLVVRKDLHMRMGKACAQTSHAAMMFITKRLNLPNCTNCSTTADIKFSKEEIEWIQTSFAKICVYVNSEEELRIIMANAFRAGLECQGVIDEGVTEFHGIHTLTCCAIGPDEAEKIDKITGHLKPL